MTPEYIARQTNRFSYLRLRCVRIFIVLFSGGCFKQTINTKTTRLVRCRCKFWEHFAKHSFEQRSHNNGDVTRVINTHYLCGKRGSSQCDI